MSAPGPAYRRRWRRALGLLVALVAGMPAAVSAGPAGGPAPPVTAEAVLLMDLSTGRVLFEKNAEGDRAPASLVKMMTLYLAYQEIRSGRVSPTDRVPVSSGAVRTPRFRIGLRTGQTVPFDLLLTAVAVASANDAATSVAEHVAGSEDQFVTRMNQEAARLGLEHTVFANPHGLPDPRQRTTARDMAVLTESLLHDFPESRELLAQTQFRWRGRVYQRRIPLFRDPGGVTALKTGFTLEAGYNVAVTAAKAGQQLLCVILGAETRGLSFLDAGRLLKFGFGEEPVGQIKRTLKRRWRGSRIKGPSATNAPAAPAPSAGAQAHSGSTTDLTMRPSPST